MVPIASESNCRGGEAVLVSQELLEVGRPKTEPENRALVGVCDLKTDRVPCIEAAFSEVVVDLLLDVVEPLRIPDAGQVGRSDT